MSRQPFKFKQFTVHQDQCAMKVGTDGVLLGAWAPLGHSPETILDIGAGTGVVALMLAQRSTAQLIDAIEIDDKAYEQCVSNFEQSPWGDRLFCYHASVQEFALEIDDQYDLIVSNPPFYPEAYKTPDKQRNLARFEDALPFGHLLACAAKLLSPSGIFAVIIPFEEEERFTAIASSVGLFVREVLHIKGTPTAKIKRSMIAFSFKKQSVLSNELVIETARHQYTEAYKDLTGEFYLKM